MSAPATRAGRGLRILLAGSDGAAKAALVVMALVVCTEVLSRGLLGVSTQVAEEVASLALILLLFLGLPGCFADGGFLRVQALLGLLPRRLADVAFHAAALAVTLVYVWQVWQLAWSSWRKGIVTDTALATPIVLPQVAMLAGLAALAVVVALRLGQALGGGVAAAAIEARDER